MDSPQIGTTLLLCQGIENLTILMEAVLAELRLQRGLKEPESDTLPTADCWRSLSAFQERRRLIFASRQIILDTAEQ
jgi:hypothetical protein